MCVSDTARGYEDRVREALSCILSHKRLVKTCTLPTYVRILSIALVCHLPYVIKQATGLVKAEDGVHQEWSKLAAPRTLAPKTQDEMRYEKIDQDTRWACPISEFHTISYLDNTRHMCEFTCHAYVYYPNSE